MSELLTVQDIASRLKVSYDTALNFVKYSGIDYIRVGRQYRVTEGKLTAFLAKKGQITVDLAETR